MSFHHGQCALTVDMYRLHGHRNKSSNHGQPHLLSPVVSLCCNPARRTVRLLLFVNVFPQSSHLYGLSPVCTRRWCVRLLLIVNVFPVITSVWFIPSMHSAVDCQTVADSKRLPAVVTSVWFIPSMHSAVDCQTVADSKRLPAVVTSVWFILSVHSAVDCQVAAVRKRLPTVVTSEWFIPSVHSSAVECQMAGVRKRLHYYTRYRQTAPPVILISWCDVTDRTGPATATGSVGGALGAGGVSVDGHRRRLLRRRMGRSRPRKTQQPSGQTTAARIGAAECCSHALSMHGGS